MVPCMLEYNMDREKARDGWSVIIFTLRATQKKKKKNWSDNRWQKRPRQATRARFYSLLTSPAWPLFFLLVYLEL